MELTSKSLIEDARLSESDSDDSGISLNRLHIKEKQLKFQAEIIGRSELVCGLPAEVSFKLAGDEIPHEVHFEITQNGTEENSNLLHVRAPVFDSVCVLKWTTMFSGDVNISITSSHYTMDNLTSNFVLQIKNNEPIATFNEEFFWPVASAVDIGRSLVYVAYSQHISVFDTDGTFIQGLMDLENGFYYDLIVCEGGDCLVASVSGFYTEDEKSQHRFQEVHVYDITDFKIAMRHIIGRDEQNSRLNTPLVLLSNKTETLFFIADIHGIKEVSTSSGLVTDEVKLSGMGSPSRLAYNAASKTHYITDAASGQLKMYSDTGELLRSVDCSESYKGLVGLSVDVDGDVLVSDLSNNKLTLLKSNFKKTAVMGSELKWPIHVSNDGKGHIFVCDHGNMCVKKFRYK